VRNRPNGGSPPVILDWGDAFVGNPAFDALRSCPDDGRSFAWIGMLRPGRDEIDAVAHEFDLHELAVEDTVNQHQRPKLERYGDSLLAVVG